jgi:hypothetical protein
MREHAIESAALAHASEPPLLLSRVPRSTLGSATTTGPHFSPLAFLLPGSAGVSRLVSRGPRPYGRACETCRPLRGAALLLLRLPPRGRPLPQMRAAASSRSARRARNFANEPRLYRLPNKKEKQQWTRK